MQHAGQKRSREQHRRQREPVLQEVSRPAGVQGFNWFTNSLKLDADGDAAHDFLVEEQQQQQQPSTTAAAVAVAAAHVQAPSQVRAYPVTFTQDQCACINGTFCCQAIQAVSLAVCPVSCCGADCTLRCRNRPSAARRPNPAVHPAGSSKQHRSTNRSTNHSSSSAST